MKSKKKSKLGSIFDIRYLFYDFVKLTGFIPAALFLRLKKYNYLKKKQKDLFKGRVIVISNHIDYFDVLVLLMTFWNRRVSFIAKDELFNPKVGNFFFKAVNAIPIQNKNVNIDTFKRAINELNAGHMVGLFPEGHVKKQEGIDKFKSGAVLLAHITGIPIVSIYIQEKEKWYHRQRIIIGKKFNVSELITSDIPSIDEIDKVTQMLYDHELELEKDIQKQIKKEY